LMYAPRMMAIAQMVRTGFMSCHVLAQPSSASGFLNQKAMMVMAQASVMVPVMAWIHTMGSCVRLSVGAKVMCCMKTGTIAVKTVMVFMVVAAVVRKPCFVRLLVWFWRLAGYTPKRSIMKATIWMTMIAKPAGSISIC
jgi:hypothetical protein